MADIVNNIKIINERINASKAKGGFTHDVKLIAVTKYQDDEDSNEAIRCGITDIGENHVQSLLRKQAALLPCNKHFIGHLQTNKVKQLISVKNLILIHSVDSFYLAKEIDKYAEHKINILIQVNVAGENSKFGIKKNDALPLLNQIKQLENISVKGFMSIMPIETKPDYYKEMYELFETSKELDKNISILSMGMSGDYEQAVMYGSNMVRIGTALFK